MNPTTEARLVDLETRYTHVERLVDELSSVVAQQQRVIDGLVKSLGDAHARIAALGSGQPNERPPHY
jgi:SlyX protein